MYSRSIAELEGKIRLQEMSNQVDTIKLTDWLGQLAHLYFVFGRLPDAERVLWRAVTLSGKCVGQEDLATAALLNDLGYLYETQCRWSEAEHVYRLSYAIRCVNLGSSHRDTLQLARAIINCCRNQGKSLPERELERLAKVSSEQNISSMRPTSAS